MAAMRQAQECKGRICCFFNSHKKFRDETKTYGTLPRPYPTTFPSLEICSNYSVLANCLTNAKCLLEQSCLKIQTSLVLYFEKRMYQNIASLRKISKKLFKPRRRFFGSRTSNVFIAKYFPYKSLYTAI